MKTLNAKNEIMKETERKKTIRVKWAIRKPPERAARVNMMYCFAKCVYQTF